MMINKWKFICHSRSKYWNCWTEGNKFFSEWGSIGSEPTSKCRTFNTEEEAENEMVELINKKLRGRKRQGIYEKYEEVKDTKKEITDNKDNSHIQSANKCGNRCSDFYLSKKLIRKHVSKWLTDCGWSINPSPEMLKRTSIHATRNQQIFIVEIIGGNQNFKSAKKKICHALGRILLILEKKEKTQYGIILPDFPEYRSIWKMISKQVKADLGLKSKFVNKEGRISN